MPPFVDPDAGSPKVIAELIRLYEESAARLKQIVLHPPGSTDTAMKFNHARAAMQLNQVQQEIDRLKKQSAQWTESTMNSQMQKGLQMGDEQLRQAGVRNDDTPIRGSFSKLDRAAIEVLARDTVGDLHKAADSMANVAGSALRAMAKNGVSVKDVNRIIAGGIIEGKPDAMIEQMQDALRKVNGKKVVIATKNGGTMTFVTDYYARLVAVSRSRQATVIGRHTQLQAHGVDLVKILGHRSKNPCSLLLGHVFSLSGKSSQYPPFSSVSHGQLPYKLFHPQCSKFTAPYVEGISTPAANADGAKGREAA